MRILFTAYPLHGHVNPMLPLARAARDAGHQVAFASGADMAGHLATHGLEPWDIGPAHAEVAATTPPSGRWFAICAEQRAAELVPRTRDWRPDLVICDEFEVAGPVAGHLAGATVVIHGLGVMPPMPIWSGLEPQIARLHHLWGLSDGAAAVRATPYLEAFPAVLRPHGERVWRRTRPLRPAPGPPGDGESLPTAIDALPHAETIHLTLGTLFHGTPGVLATALAGLRDLPLNIVVTCGPGVDPARFGPQPAHVLIAPYIPHALLLPRCRLVVSQGGAGIMLGAMSHGLPQLMLPLGADQFINADACTRAGAALALPPDAFTAGAVTAATERLLAEPSFTRAAHALGEAIRAMPDADEVLAGLVREARTGVRHQACV